MYVMCLRLYLCVLRGPCVVSDLWVHFVHWVNLDSRIMFTVWRFISLMLSVFYIFILPYTLVVTYMYCIVFTWGWPTLAETCSECNYVIICKRIFGCYRGKVFVFYFWHIETGCTHQLLKCTTIFTTHIYIYIYILFLSGVKLGCNIYICHKSIILVTTKYPACMKVVQMKCL
jgi:hypothetical protein